MNKLKYHLLLIGLWGLGLYSAQAQLLVNEIKVNAPGQDDPFEFIELKGTPNTTINNYYFVAFEGDPGSAGEADIVFPVNNVTLKGNGLLLYATSLGYSNIPAETNFVDTLLFAIPGGYIENGSNTFATIFSTIPIVRGFDYDSDNDGVLELPPGAVVIDAVGYTNGNPDAILYNGITALTQSAGTPDALVRFYGNAVPNSFSAWYNGDLLGDPNTVMFDPLKVSANFPSGGMLSPGNHNLPNSLSVRSLNQQLQFMVYPNPATDMLMLEIQQNVTSAYHIIITDMTGKVILNNSENTSVNKFIDISALNNGMYMISVVLNDGTVNHARFIKQ
jgi:hypothetical protein